MTVAVAAFWAGTVACLLCSLARTDGHISYALDDAYINMAMAKNLSRHGVWGITKYGFSFTSSSLFWPPLLAAFYFLFGVNDITPLVLNVLFGTLACAAAYAVLNRSLGRRALVLVTLLLFVFLTPLIPLTFAGMEHTLQTFLALTFAYVSARAVARGEPTARQLVSITALAAFLTLTRYEGIFLVFIVAALFLSRNRIRAALLVTAGGLFPIVSFGGISMAKGWYFLPNSVLTKTANVSLLPLRMRTFLSLPGLENLYGAPHMLTLVLAALMAFALAVRKSRDVRREAAILPVIFVVAAFLHVQYAQTGHFYRYESYLVALGVVTVAVALAAGWPDRLGPTRGKYAASYVGAVALFLFFAGWPLAQRAVRAYRETPQATMNIFHQQYQMGLFLREYYQRRTVAANDVGAINYLADVKCLDLTGLGTMAVARAKKHREYGTAFMAALAEAEGARIAVVYPRWYKAYGGLPREWSRVGAWKIPDNYVCAYDEVSFFALTAEEQFRLFHNLRRFSERLPAGVEERGPLARPASRRATPTR